MLLTPKEQERMNWLCQRIQEENDHSKFIALVRELNELLERKERQIEEPLEPTG
jgi:hypothetical protein